MHIRKADPAWIGFQSPFVKLCKLKALFRAWLSAGLFEASGCLPDESQEEEKEWNDGQDVDQRIEKFVAFGQGSHQHHQLHVKRL